MHRLSTKIASLLLLHFACTATVQTKQLFFAPRNIYEPPLNSNFVEILVKIYICIKNF